MSRPRWLRLLTATFPALALARVWNVPDECPTIQVALDTLGIGDTVLVSPGTYHEALHGRSGFFWLMGDVDTSQTPSRPVVDPSPLEGSTHLACLTLPLAAVVTVEDMIFRNGAQMFPRDPPDARGGIIDSAVQLTVRRCLFDSTDTGICQLDTVPVTLEIYDCEFMANPRVCLTELGEGPTSAVNCVFRGRVMQAWFTDGAVVENCSFGELPPGGGWVWFSGETIVRGCRFGPSVTTGHAAAQVWEGRHCVFEDNLFQDLVLSGAPILFESLEFGDTSIFRNNVFERCRGDHIAAAGGGIDIEGQGGGGWPAEVTDCIFDSCTAWWGSETAFGAIKCGSAAVSISNCQFTKHGAHAPTVEFLESQWSTMHECRFDSTDWAVFSDSVSNPDTVWHINAENNWWGDSTGPYHAVLNPSGLGDTIVGPVDFVPWLTDTNLAVTEPPRAIQPISFGLSAYPNPFNATVRLILVPNGAGTVKVELFDILGRKLADVWQGSLAVQKEVVFDASGLASGVYVARVTGVSSRNPLATAKVVLLR